MSIVTSDPPSRPARLGEELPVFCERCGYSLHGLTQVRCEQCQVLQFHCPECGHHQPINTLRPAAQRILGRLRAGWLVVVVFFKLNYFGWLLIAWAAMGTEWSYGYNYTYTTNAAGQRIMTNPTLAARPITWEMILAFGFFALPFGLVSRMLLLRWRRGWATGLALAALVMLAIWIGAKLHAFNMRPTRWVQLRSDFMALIYYTGGVVMLGAMVAWPIWTALVTVFIPKSVAGSLLEWQRSQSDRPTSSLARA